MIIQTMIIKTEDTTAVMHKKPIHYKNMNVGVAKVGKE